jgi:hypothetical protein
VGLSFIPKLYYLLPGSWIIDPRFADDHNIVEEEEILSQVTMLFGNIPMELIKAGMQGHEFYSGDTSVP